jgi:hypothetical protein
MCNFSFMVCISCAEASKKMSACGAFDEAKKTKGYETMESADWMLEHVSEKADRVRVDVRFVFCPKCKNLDKPGFSVDARKVSKAAEKATKRCLGQFRFMLPDGKVLNQWKKTDFGKVDLDKYMTTDTEATENDSEDDDEDSGSDAE